MRSFLTVPVIVVLVVAVIVQVELRSAGEEEKETEEVVKGRIPQNNTTHLHWGDHTFHLTNGKPCWCGSV